MSTENEPQGFHVVMTGFTTKMGKLKVMAIRKAWARLIDESVAAEILLDLKNGKARHFPLMKPEQKTLSTEQVQQAIDALGKTGIASEICACSYDEASDEEARETGLLSLATALRTESRSRALRLLLEAAQTDPRACDILIDDALERNDVVQADHWQSKKHQLHAPVKQAPDTTSDEPRRSTWMGVSQEVDGGDF